MIKIQSVSSLSRRYFSVLPQFKGALKNKEKVSVHSKNQNFTYSDLLFHSNEIANTIRASCGNLHSKHVAFLVPPSFEHAAVKHGIWLAGGVSVPLCTTHPDPELKYVIEDSKAAVLITHSKYRHAQKLCDPNLVKIIEIDDFFPTKKLFNEELIFEHTDLSQRALLIYTSGTTGRPKGAVWTHRNLNNQIDCLLNAWKWTENDHILHLLPLHHIHGIVNKMLCATKIGASITFQTFEPRSMWKLLLSDHDFTLFMGVPTLYIKLLNAYESLSIEDKKKAFHKLSQFRLMISGSASLPSPIFEQWKEISGHRLLERYGMTEIGMSLSNPYEPMEDRIGGSVGFPLSGVETKILDDGMLCIRSNAMFTEYWNKPEATKKSFLDGGWFETGDIVEVSKDTGRFFIRGRKSQDIIKSFGFKVSALEVERELLCHPKIRAAACCGVPSQTYGETVGAAIELKNSNESVTLKSLYLFLKERIPQYALPRHLKILEQIPRNIMGKVDKNDIKKLFDHKS